MQYTDDMDQFNPKTPDNFFRKYIALLNINLKFKQTLFIILDFFCCCCKIRASVLNDVIIYT